MRDYTPAQLREHLQWLYRQPNYYKEKKPFTHGGKREKIFDPTKTKAAEGKKSLREKLTGFKTQKAFEEARDKRRIQKRITKMKERKNQGKNYSAKNLAELEAKLKDM